MVEDARFEDGAEQPLRLAALDGDDLAVVSALGQDALFGAADMRYESQKRRFALLLNRFRWEDADKAKRRDRDVERVRTLLVVNDVLHVASQGIDRDDPDLVYALLSIEFMPGAEGAGRLTLTLAGDGAIALDVECLDVILQDVTRPYLAPSRKTPSHD